jgi:hypothetical protein
MVEMLFIILLFMIILILTIIISRIKAIVVASHSRKMIILLQVFVLLGAAFVFKSYTTFLINMFLTSLFYSLVDKCDKYEKKLEINNPTRQMKNFFYSLFGIVIIFFRYIQRCLVFISSTLLLSRLVDIKDKSELVNSINGIISLCLLFILMMDFVEFNSGVKGRFIIVLGSIFVFLGLFNSKWWSGISLLVSILGLAFSNEFVVRFLNKEVDETKKSFYKFLIPYITLIFYVSMVIVQDVVPQSLLNSLYKFIQGISGNKDESIEASFINMALIKGVIEIGIFSGGWLFLKRILKALGIFNTSFFEELDSVEENLKSKLKEISSIK